MKRRIVFWSAVGTVTATGTTQKNALKMVEHWLIRYLLIRDFKQFAGQSPTAFLAAQSEFGRCFTQT